MNKAIAVIITLATLGAATYLLSRNSGNAQTAAISADTQTAGQTASQATGNGNQYRYGQQNTARPNPSATTQTS